MPQCKYYPDSSIGISIYPDDHSEVGTLLRSADAAMYAAKQGRRGDFRLFRDGGKDGSAEK